MLLNIDANFRASGDGYSWGRNQYRPEPTEFFYLPYRDDVGWSGNGYGNGDDGDYCDGDGWVDGYEVKLEVVNIVNASGEGPLIWSLVRCY